MSTSTSTSPRGTSRRVDAALPVGHRRAGPGPGQLDLRGHVGRARRTQAQRPRVDGVEVGRGGEAERGQLFELLLALRDDRAQGGGRRDAAHFVATGRPGRPCGVPARPSSSRARPGRAGPARPAPSTAAGGRRPGPRGGSGRPPPRAGRRTSPASGTSRSRRTRWARPPMRRRRRQDAPPPLRWTPQPVRELEVVARQGAQRPGRRALEVLGRIQPSLVEVVPDDDALGAADAGHGADGDAKPAASNSTR